MNIKKQLLNIKKPTIILLSFFLVFCCFGCGDYETSSSPQDTMKQKLKEKYGITVSIDNLNEEAGIQMFQESSYTAIATDEENGYAFNVLLGKSTNNVKDDYAKFLYESQIRETVDNVINTHIENGIPFSDYSISYDLTEKTFTNENQLDEYLDDRLAIVQFTIDLDYADTEMAEKIYNFATELKGNHIPFELEIHKNRDTIILNNVDSSANDSYEMYLQRIAE